MAIRQQARRLAKFYEHVLKPSAVLYGATNLLALATRVFPMRLVIECHEQMAIKILSSQSPVQ